MKRLLFLVLLFVSFEASAQKAAGLWRGRFTSVSILQQEVSYIYELLLFQNGDSLTGYSYSSVTTGDFYAVCEIKGRVYDEYMVVTELKTLYQNPPEPEGNMQSHILFFTADNNEVTGEWKETTKRPMQILVETGKTFLKKEEDPSKSGLIKILEKKEVIKVADPTVKPAVVNPPIVNNDSIKLASRQKEILQTIESTADSVTIELYDDGLLDGDSVSVFYNNRILLNNILLSDKAIKQVVHLPLTKEGIIISMFAENEGSIPPNTGLLIIREGQKRYEVRFSSDKKKSAAVMLRKK